MTRDEIVERLRAHEPELRAAGVEKLSVIGSFARGDDEENSDVDVVIRIADEMRRSGFAYFGHLDELNQRLEAILGRAVDIIPEPIKSDRLRRQIEKERIVAF